MPHLSHSVSYFPFYSIQFASFEFLNGVSLTLEHPGFYFHLVGKYPYKVNKEVIRETPMDVV